MTDRDCGNLGWCGFGTIDGVAAPCKRHNPSRRVRRKRKQLPLTPANTEADVERERLARCLESYATGMDRLHRDIADDFRKAASIVRGSTPSLTRPAGGEEVGRLREALARCETVFGQYAEMHRAKLPAAEAYDPRGAMEIADKVQRNVDMADLCRAALATPQQAPDA